MRKRTLLGENIIGKPIIDANYGDICFYDKANDNKIIVSLDSFSASEYPLEEYTPIGIVAVPSAHTEEKRPRIVSLLYMDYNNPDNGNMRLEAPEIYWGGNGEEIEGLLIKGQLPQLTELTENSTVIYSNYACYLPTDQEFDYPNPLNSKEWFYSSQYEMCSPYKEDDSLEKRYFDTSNSGNVLADFDGKTNTARILAKDNSNSTNWQTATTITNRYDSRYVHPAAQVTYLFHTEGTNKGDWYLPSAGELGYAIARQKAIENTFTVINEGYKTTLACTFGVKNSHGYNTSTFDSVQYCVEMYFYNGLIGSGNTKSTRYVRAFFIV